MTEPARAFLALGANLGDPVANVTGGAAALAASDGVTLVARSPLYRTPPLGPPGQPDYVNAVLEIATTLEPEALLDACQSVESRFGRTRDGARWGPRTLDVDVLLYGDRIVHTARLDVPHPEMTARAFVMVPLAAIAPDVTIPGYGRVADLAAPFAGAPLERLP